MSDISERHTHDVITRHPDLAEMRDRYDRVMRGREDSTLDGLVVLTGLYAAVSPWIVHFSVANPNLRVNNLIVGLAIAAFGLGLTLAPERMSRLGWACSLTGVWLIISAWIATAGHHPSTGAIWNNVLVGAVACVLGLAAAAIRLASSMAANRTNREESMGSSRPNT